MGRVTHHSIELHWDPARTAKRQGPQGQWTQFSIEEEDPRTHTYGAIYMWVLAAPAASWLPRLAAGPAASEAPEGGG